MKLNKIGEIGDVNLINLSNIMYITLLYYCDVILYHIIIYLYYCDVLSTSHYYITVGDEVFLLHLNLGPLCIVRSQC